MLFWRRFVLLLCNWNCHVLSFVLKQEGKPINTKKEDEYTGSWICFWLNWVVTETTLTFTIRLKTSPNNYVHTFEAFSLSTNKDLDDLLSYVLMNFSECKQNWKKKLINKNARIQYLFYCQLVNINIIITSITLMEIFSLA